MSVSHRETDGPYQRLQTRTTEQLRSLLEIPRNYHVLFMQGGAHGQFAALPLNLGNGSLNCASVETGFWAQRSAREMDKYLRVHVAGSADSGRGVFDTVPDSATWQLPPSCAFVHMCANETIHGVEFLKDPDVSLCRTADDALRRPNHPLAHDKPGSSFQPAYPGAYTILPNTYPATYLNANGAHTYTPSHAHSFSTSATPIATGVSERGLDGGASSPSSSPPSSSSPPPPPSSSSPPPSSSPPSSSSSSPRRPPPLAADFTSTLLSRPVDVSKYGVIYCSGGKNLGPAGVTVVIVRDDLLEESLELSCCPSVLSYRKFAFSKPVHSVYATPPTYSVYLVSLVLEHLAASGGLAHAERAAVRRAEQIYEEIDASAGFYSNSVTEGSRSRMSVPFRVGGDRSADESIRLEQSFISEAEARGFRHIAGHPLFGGLRASLYHGVADESVSALAAFMAEFRRRNC